MRNAVANDAKLNEIDDSIPGWRRCLTKSADTSRVSQPLTMRGAWLGLWSKWGLVQEALHPCQLMLHCWM